MKNNRDEKCMLNLCKAVCNYSILRKQVFYDDIGKCTRILVIFTLTTGTSLYANLLS